MEKKLSDYLHLYMGCEFQWNNGIGKYNKELTALWLKGFKVGDFRIEDAKLLLRPLSSMTDDEAKHFKVTKGIDRNLQTLGGSIWTFDEVKQLLSLHFDLFDLIPAHLAIDKTTLS